MTTGGADLAIGAEGFDIGEGIGDVVRFDEGKGASTEASKSFDDPVSVLEYPNPLGRNNLLKHPSQYGF